MPVFNQPLRTDVYESIVGGKFIDSDYDVTTFEKFLNILNELPPCPKIETTNYGRPMFPSGGSPLPCIKPDEHTPIKQITFLQDLFKNNQSINSFNYLRSVIDQRPQDIQIDAVEKLVKLCNIFFQIPVLPNLNFNLNLTKQAINNISQAYFDFFASIARQPEAIHVRTNIESNPIIFHIMDLSAGYFNTLKKLNDNATTKSSNLTYSLFEPLKSYLRGLGDLALNFRNKYPEGDLSQFENNAVRLINSMSSLTTDQLNTLRHTFVSQYHSDHDIVKECQRVFETECDPYNVSGPYEFIKKGESFASLDLTDQSLAKNLSSKLLFGNQDDIEKRLTTLIITKNRNGNNGLAHFLNYFKVSVQESNKNNQTLPVDYVEKLCKLPFYLTSVFNATNPKSKIYDSSFSLLLTIFKNPDLDTQKLEHALRALLNDSSNQMLAFLQTPQAVTKSSMDILATVFHQTNDIAAVSPEQKLEIAKKMGALSEICVKIANCSFSAINQFSKTLGSMVRSLSKQDSSQSEISAANEIEKIAQKNYYNAYNVRQAESKDLALNYVKGRYDKKIDEYENACKRLFNLSNCQELAASNGTIEQGSTAPTTLTPKTEKPIDGLALNTTIAAPIINQTTPAVFVDPIAATELSSYSNSTIASNQTVTETIENSRNGSALSDSEIQIGVAAGYGAGMGAYNATVRHFYPNSINLTIVGNALIATGFPLMQYGVEQYFGSDTQDLAALTWQDMAWQMPTNFAGSLLLNSGLHYANVAANDIPSFVSNHPTLKFVTERIAPHIIPFVVTVSSAIKKPVETAVQMGTSLVASSTMSGLLHCFFPRKKIKPSDIETTNENNAHEMKPLNNGKNHISNEDINLFPKSLTPEQENFFQKTKFISLSSLDKMTMFLNQIISDTQEFSNIQILQPSKVLLQTRLEALKNLYEGLKSKDFIKSSKNMTPEDAENQYKHNCESLKFLIESINKELQTNHFFSEDRNLKADLNKIEGLNFRDHTFEFKSQLGKIRDNIGFVDTIIKAALGPGENNCSNQNKPQDNRRNTIAFYSSGSEGETRFSTASSSDESAKSDGYGNTALNNIEEQQQEPLMNTRLA
ncbi:MAG: hypothetical protein WA659_04315 [Candidatus Aquirickettsiella sp.]